MTKEQKDYRRFWRGDKWPKNVINKSAKSDVNPFVINVLPKPGDVK